MVVRNEQMTALAEEYEATERSTFLERQLVNRENVKDFFKEDGNYERLERLMNEGEEVCAVIMYFSTEYSRNRVFQTSTGLFCPSDCYRYELRSNLKRFYDFENRAGQGDLWFKGNLNPRIPANEEAGSISLSLPRLVALRWFIKNEFDLIFWERYEDIKRCHKAFTLYKKQKYTETHKNKKKLLRQRIEHSVIETREKRKEENETKKSTRKRKTVASDDDADSVNSKKRKETRLSRADRKLVVEMISEEKKKAREFNKLQRAKYKKRDANTTNKEKSACLPDVAEDVPVVVEF